MTVKVTINDCRAGGEPKMFGGETGGKVARVSVASNDQVKAADGTFKTEATWLPVVAFGPAARFIEANVHKGTQLAIEGELRNRTYEDTAKVKHTVSEIYVIPGRGKIELAEAVGDRGMNSAQGEAPAA